MHASLILLPLLSASPLPTLSSWTKQVCLTSYAATSGAVSSTTQTRSYTIPQTQITVITPSTTVTAAVPTTTVTTTIVDTSTVTGQQVIATTTTTATSVVTNTATTTISSTEIDTVTSTITSTSSTTTTFSTSSGFTPIASIPSVVQSGGGTRAKRALESDEATLEERDAMMEDGELEKRTAVSSSSAKASASLNTVPSSSVKASSTLKVVSSSSAKASATPTFQSDCDKNQPYPSVITCYKAVVTVSISYRTVTAAKTTTFTVGNPTTVSVTSTVRSSTTITVLPAATTVTSSTTTTNTVTTTATATSATTTTTTVSTTTTSYLPLQTAYAACGADNLINRVGSTNINDAARYTGTTFLRTSDQTADACCVACQSTANCGGFLFRQATNGVVACDLAIVTTCSPTFVAFRFVARSQPAFVATAGDGPCGQGTWGGLQ
ncbi:hypothetical protein AMS68_008061 [Peltaster fructicola]|uniref:Apple domain-containing protein n=1 Tax=Peltaster fructicola TaxID=286661 RepID=A0A6H0Y685_9PEZI|nr:hypothetical protein AMS68_008061 [Peltaster fructicola]